MEKYKIKFSIEAKNDYLDIIRYIRYNLVEPAIAKKYAKLIKEEIKKLEYNPQKFATIDIEIKNHSDIRKFIIKNYIAFYRINESNKIVSIERILYVPLIGKTKYKKIIIKTNCRERGKMKWLK